MYARSVAGWTQPRGRLTPRPGGVTPGAGSKATWRDTRMRPISTRRSGDLDRSMSILCRQRSKLGSDGGFISCRTDHAIDPLSRGGERNRMIKTIAIALAALFVSGTAFAQY